MTPIAIPIPIDPKKIREKRKIGLRPPDVSVAIPTTVLFLK